MALYLSPIAIGDDALVGGYSLLLPGCEVADGEVTPPFRTMHAFSRFENGRRMPGPDALDSDGWRQAALARHSRAAETAAEAAVEPASAEDVE